MNRGGLVRQAPTSDFPFAFEAELRLYSQSPRSDDDDTPDALQRDPRRGRQARASAGTALYRLCARGRGRRGRFSRLPARAWCRRILGPEAGGLPRMVMLLWWRSPVSSTCFPLSIEASRRLHAQRPDTEIILGGPGPSGSAGRLLELYPWISGVVRGEGEETIQEWAQRRQGRSTAVGPVAGMTYRDGAVIVAGPDRQTNRRTRESSPDRRIIWSIGRLMTTPGSSRPAAVPTAVRSAT